MTALIILGSLCAVLVAALLAAMVYMGRALASAGKLTHKMGDQLIANSDFQITRIEAENGLAAVQEHSKAVRRLNGHIPLEEGVMDMPDRVG